MIGKRTAARLTSRYGTLLFLLMTLGLALAPGVQRSAHAAVLLDRAVVVTGEWPPFTSERMPGGGLLSALVSEVLKGMDREPVYEFLPFANALQMTDEGKAIGTFPWFRNAEREKAFAYSNPILEVEYVVFFNPTIQSPIRDVAAFEDLKELKTVRVAGYAYGKLDCLLDFGNVECPQDAPPVADLGVVESEYRAFEMLRDGEIDYLAASRAVGESLIDRAFPMEDRRKFGVLDRPALTWSMGVHFLFPRSRPDANDLKQAFDRALAGIEASGRVAELRQTIEWQGRWKGRVVSLHEPGTGAPLAGHPRRGVADFVLLPRGSRAVVLEWSGYFLGTATDPEEPSMSYVQLLNGPLRGERLWVRDEIVELEGE